MRRTKVSFKGGSSEAKLPFSQKKTRAKIKQKHKYMYERLFQISQLEDFKY